MQFIECIYYVCVCGCEVTIFVEYYSFSLLLLLHHFALYGLTIEEVPKDRISQRRGILKTNFDRNENLLSKFTIENGHPIGMVRIRTI